jgi:hypothetical protein
MKPNRRHARQVGRAWAVSSSMMMLLSETKSAS